MPRSTLPLLLILASLLDLEGCSDFRLNASSSVADQIPPATFWTIRSLLKLPTISSRKKPTPIQRPRSKPSISIELGLLLSRSTTMGKFQIRQTVASSASVSVVQPTITLALSSTFTPAASCTANKLTMLPPPGYYIWANVIFFHPRTFYSYALIT